MTKEELEKENAELKAQLESERYLPAIAYMQGAEKQKKKDEEQLTKAKEYFPNDEFKQQIVIDAINWATEELQKENAELKADNDARKFAMAMSEKVEKQLREENSKLKNEWQEQVQKATDEGYARTLQTMQLTKAKDLLLRFVELKNKPCASGHSINMLFYENICAETEQFLNSEMEK